MLQIIAMIKMLIDHVGVVLGETSKYYYIYRVIGLLSMPVYAFFICEGYKHTHDKWKYTARLAAIGASAQIGYMYIVKSFSLNICFVWVLASVWLYIYEHCKKWAVVLYSICCGVLICVLPLHITLITKPKKTLSRVFSVLQYVRGLTI